MLLELRNNETFLAFNFKSRGLRVPSSAMKTPAAILCALCHRHLFIPFARHLGLLQTNCIVGGGVW